MLRRVSCYGRALCASLRCKLTIQELKLAMSGITPPRTEKGDGGGGGGGDDDDDDNNNNNNNTL